MRVLSIFLAVFVAAAGPTLACRPPQTQKELFKRLSERGLDVRGGGDGTKSGSAVIVAADNLVTKILANCTTTRDPKACEAGVLFGMHEVIDQFSQSCNLQRRHDSKVSTRTLHGWLHALTRRDQECLYSEKWGAVVCPTADMALALGEESSKPCSDDNNGTKTPVDQFGSLICTQGEWKIDEFHGDGQS